MQKRFMKRFSSLIFSLATAGSVCSQTVDVVQKHVPVLTHKSGNEVMQIRVAGLQGGNVATEVAFDLAGTVALRDIESLKLFYRAGKSKDSVPFGGTLPPDEKVRFRGRQPIEPGTGVFSLYVKLRDDADILHTLTARCEEIVMDNIRMKPGPDYKPITLRFGTALRQQFQEGVHTYRIPGLVKTTQGTLLAIYDQRLDAFRDPQGRCTIGLQRSTDGGRTWEPVKTIMDRGAWGGLDPKMNGVTDACILVNDRNNEVFVGALWMHGQWMNGKWEGVPSDPNAELGRKRASQPGMTEKETCQFLMTRSTDDGKSWSEPVNLTGIKKPEWPLFAVSPTNGITLDDGTLVFPTKVPGRVALTYSKDGGRTWTVSGLGPETNGAENAIVQLNDGSIMLNARSMGKSTYRTVYTTPDLGKTWVEHPTNIKVLSEPGCHASLFKHTYSVNGMKRSVLLFSNPDSDKKRERMTLKVSFDEGMTWPEKYWILLDEGRSAYSSIASIDEGTIGILYEGSQAQMTFQRISLSEILGR
jgi:sialidase-1